VRWWNRFFQEQDEVSLILSDLRKQGSSRARVAHFFASLLVVLFSAGSLVALGNDALNAVLEQWQADHTLNIPSTITLAVTFLMVIAMDIGLIHAAGMLRVLAARRAQFGERWVHIGVMIVVSALESGSYAYMSWKYEHPVSLAAQVLISARALAAPLLAVYLSTARAVPVTARDMLAYAELSAGGGVLRDIVKAANDHSIDLPRFAYKMKLFGASAVMIPEDRARLQSMIAAVAEGTGSVGHSTHTQEGTQSADTANPFSRVEPLEPSESPPNDKPPTGPGSPTASPVRTDDSAAEKTKTSAAIRLVSGRQQRVATRGSNRRPVRTPPLGPNLEDLARKAWANGHTSIERMRRATGMSRTAAASWVRTLKAESAIRAKQNSQQTAQERLEQPY
jgi:hypothetical protein